jgi:DtxR family Mn-dependent transcriptional regulator
MQKELSSTLEDYLEAIFRIENKKRAARVRDISSRLNVAKSTVNAALKSLAGKKLIHYEPYELIVLTEKGREKASSIFRSHQIIRHFMQEVLALDDEKADRIACTMEHAIDREVLERFVCFLAYISRKEEKTGAWLDEFKSFIKDGSNGISCKDCVKGYMDKMQSEIDIEWGLGWPE